MNGTATAVFGRRITWTILIAQLGSVERIAFFLRDDADCEERDDQERVERGDGRHDW